MRVIIADDDPQIRRLLLRALTPMGHECVAVSGAAELLRLCLRDPADWVISDIGLEDGDGIDACLALRKDHPQTRFILMTGDPEHFDRALRAGFKAVLHKPFELEHLRRLLKQAAG